MSSFPTAPTSTTPSSTSSRSRADARTVVVACGAIAAHCQDLVDRFGWAAEVHPLPPLLHNHPERIAAEVERVVTAARRHGRRVVVGYADCGTYGALDEVCGRLGVPRLRGLHCYDVFAGPSQIREFFEADAGTYVLTDFLVRSFARTVIAELGLDRHPELRDDYFGHYHRVVWLAQEPDEELHRLAADAAYRIGLPLRVVETGTGRLERALRLMLNADLDADLSD